MYGGEHPILANIAIAIVGVRQCRTPGIAVPLPLNGICV